MCSSDLAVGKKRGHFSCQVKFLEKIIRQYSINQNVLDASCATGDVLNEVADTFEEINFFGTDEIGRASCRERV